MRCTTRFVGYLIGWFRGPLIDIHADRFYMRLRPTTSTSAANLRRPWVRFLHIFQSGVAAVNRGYWFTLSRNVLSRLFAYILRFFRIRVEKIRVWKDAGSWELRIEQFVFSGHAYQLLGCKYCLSINELLVSICKPPRDACSLLHPIRAIFALRRGFELDARLGSNLFAVFRHQRFVILDDLHISLNASHISCQAPHVLLASIGEFNVNLSPGRSRALLAKLPPVAPVSRRTHQPSILEYWEGSVEVNDVSIRFTAPVAPPSSSNDMRSCSSILLSFDGCSAGDLFAAAPSADVGVFVRLDSFRVEAYGKTANERCDPMMHASLVLLGCSAGSTSVDALSHALYEVAPTGADEAEHSKTGHAPGRVESVENVEKIVAARPEALVWVEETTVGYDMNCSKHYASRIDVAGRGGVIALEPVGFVMLINELLAFIGNYWNRESQRQTSNLIDDSESLSSSSRTGSTSSLSSIYSEPRSIRFVCDMRHWTAVVLGRGPIGDGDTMAVVASCENVLLSQVDIFNSSLLHLSGSSKDFEVVHWSRWTRTRNVFCEETKFDIQRGPNDGKIIELYNAVVDWDLDAHSGIEMLPSLFATLKDLRSSTSALRSFDNGEDALWVPSFPPRPDYDRTHLSEAERRDHRDKRRIKFLDSLGAWQLSGKNVSVTVSYPDGPKLGLSVGELPRFKLSTETFVGHHVVLSLQDYKCAYGEVLKLSSPFHSMNSSLEKRSLVIDVQKFVIFLGHEVQLGYLLQDWILRLRTTIRVLRESKWQKRGMAPPKPKKQPMIDIHFKSSDLEVFFEDHPIGCFLTRILPLMQDEARERVLRDELMYNLQEQLRKIARAEITGTPHRFQEALKVKDSEIWVKRVKDLRKGTAPYKIANGYLPKMDQPPSSSFTATSLSFDVVLDDLARQMGSIESIRRLKLLDDYELGLKKHKKTRQYDRDAWNSIGFRGVGFEARVVSIKLRDYPYPFLVIDRMYFDNTTMGQAVQTTVAPYTSETTVAIGKRRLVKLERGLGPSKTFADIHLKLDTLHCHFNPSYLAAIADFGRGVSRFFSGGKNPSPRIPWFDSLRFNMHGRMRLTARKFTGVLTSSVSPYSLTDHYVKIESDDFEMLTSRLQATEEDPFPICWKLHNWRIRPSNFHKICPSEIAFNCVRVGITPVMTVESGDPQDHYVVPFPTKEEIAKGGPGIGRGNAIVIRSEKPVDFKDNGYGSFTDWWTGLHEIPGFDSFAGFKTQTMILGLDINICHPAQQSESVPRGSIQSFPEGNKSSLSPSVMYSDAISTLTKVVKGIYQRPISCRLPPRQLSLMRKPPSKTGLSTSLRGLDVKITAKNLNFMLYNNLEPGHGLFVSISSLCGELWKRTDVSFAENGDNKRTSRLTRRRFDIIDIYSSIQVPGLDMAVDSDDMGKLLTVDKISLSDDLHDEMKYIASPRKGGVISPSSGFGSEELDESPFYTFSASHPLQRGKSLDKVQYDKRLLVDGVRLIWSPVRRISMFSWPDAFKVKTFCMKAREAVFPSGLQQDEIIGPDSSYSPNEQAGVGKKSNRAPRSPIIDNTIDTNCREIENFPAIPNFKLSGSRLSAELSSDSQRTHSNEASTDDVESASGHVDLEASDPGKSSTWVMSPIMPLTRSKAMVRRKHVGSMVDLLGPDESSQSSSETQEKNLNFGKVELQKKTRCVLDTLKTSPRIALYINDCEVVFGSPETIGHVFLRSKAVRVGIVDKLVQKSMQLGERNEGWVDREYRFHLEGAEVLTRDKASGRFDFNARNWVPQESPESNYMSLVTQKPISMDLMYISSSSPREGTDDEEDDHTLRPKLLFINVPHIRLSTNACEFHAITDVVRKVLMQSMRSSELVNEELSNLRYKLQLAGGKVTSVELENFMRQLNTITRQFLYCGDTFQHHLVNALILPGERTFSDTLLRYKAKAKAIATFMRNDQRATTTDVLYPTMYISYSFDECSWELREARNEQNKEVEDGFVVISLEHLVCRHIFYVGRGSSTEITFGNISALNKMQYSYFKRILQPAGPGNGLCPGQEKRKTSCIKASDGATVAFRWYSTQEDRVGGIPVYELLTIQVAPMTAAVTRKLYSSVSDFIFSSRTRADGESVGNEAQEGRRTGGFSRASSKSQGDFGSDQLTRTASYEAGLLGKRHAIGNNLNLIPKPSLDDVSQMAQRGGSNMLFKYVFIDAFELTASYKNKDTENRGALDVFDLFVRTPSFSYSSKIWSWKAFSSQIRRDLVTTFFLRGASNLAKIKFLPGYSRARKRLVQGADSVKESLYSRFDAATSNTYDSITTHHDDDDVHDGLKDDESEDNVTDMDEQQDAQDRIDAAVIDIGGAGDPDKREKVLKALYGENAVCGSGGLHSRKLKNTGWTRDFGTTDSSSHESSGFRARARAFASGRSRGGSSRSHVSNEENGRESIFRRLRRLGHHHDI